MQILSQPRRLDFICKEKVIGSCFDVIHKRLAFHVKASYFWSIITRCMDGEETQTYIKSMTNTLKPVHREHDSIIEIRIYIHRHKIWTQRIQYGFHISKG